MQSFLKEQNKERIQNLDQLEDYLLDIPSVTCVHGEGTEVVLIKLQIQCSNCYKNYAFLGYECSEVLEMIFIF
jgi:hypothetical protein